MNKSITTIIAVAIIVGGGAFWGGMKYTESKSPTGQFSRGDFQGFSPEERQQRFQGLGANVGSAFGGDHAENGGFRGSGVDRSLSGEIISQGDDSFTIKLGDGSTRIVFVSDSTQIIKSVDGIVDDLKKGEQIFVSGDANPDGSYTAQTIQLNSLNYNQ